MSSTNHPAPFRRPARRQRGVVLIFVVAVLVLLAIIATTYLATARIDRVASEVKGGLAAGNDDAVPFPLEELRLDLFGDWWDSGTKTVKPEANWKFRPVDQATPQYLNVDTLDERVEFLLLDTDPDYLNRQLHDPFLASRVPEPFDGNNFSSAGGPTFYPAWPKISRWVERWTPDGWVFTTAANNNGTFESPTNGGERYQARTTVVPTYFRVDYGLGFQTPAEYNGQTAIYPAFRLPKATGGANGSPAITYIAGDTDGDGVADAGLFPLNDWFENGVPVRPDELIPAGYFYPADPLTHKRRWYAAIRVVDNTASINVNTAWRRNADIPMSAAGDPAGTLVPPTPAPNYGFFRSNVGLFELLPGLIGTYQEQWTRFANIRFGGLKPGLSGRPDYEFSTFAEALEMNLARRPFSAGGTGHGFSSGLSASLGYLNGLINPRESQSELETAFDYDLYRFVPNWGAANTPTTADPLERDKETRSFTFFSAPSIELMGGDTVKYIPKLWWNSLYNPDTGSRNAYFGGIGAYAGTPPPLPKRHLLTTSNPQGTSTRVGQADPLAWFIDEEVGKSYGMVPFPASARPKVGINTDPFGALWRNFFLTMLDPTSVGPIFNPADTAILGNGRNIALVAQDAIYLRSALAAVNAVDQRDGDDDVTTVRIHVPSGREVMVAGAERQLFITKVEPSGGDLNVTLTNPYNRPIDPKCYSLAFMPAGGGNYTTPVPLPASPPLTQNLTISVSITKPTVGSGDLVLLRTRRADGTKVVSTDTKNKYDENLIQDLVCVDLVVIGDYTAPLSVDYVRDTASWKIASSGQSFVTPGNIDNPVALDNLPTGVTAATATTGNKFPLSGYPRNGDMMTVPYVGHYAIYSGGSLVDATPITFDVEKVPLAAAPQITGRFTPILTAGSYANDWRSRIFDNFTTLANPMSDALPNIARESWLKGTQTPAPVTQNDPSVPDVTSPVHGLININTASAEVLRMVPFCTLAADGTVDVAANDAIVQAILTHRRTIGSFSSVLDLMQVTGFNFAGAKNKQGNFYEGSVEGTKAPMPGFADGYHSFIRVSNLLTTRSDSFIVYVLVQQWQDFDTATPLLVPGTEKRFAAVIDRSQLRESVKTDEFMKLESLSTN